MGRFAFSVNERRTLARGAVVLSAILVLGRGLPSWRGWRTRTRDEVRNGAAALAGARALLGDTAEVRDSLRARVTRLAEVARTTVKGASSARAGAALAALVAGAADSAGIAVGALDVRADSASDAVPSIAVAGSATGDVTGVTRFLSLLEGGQPHVSVRRLAITQPDVAAPDAQAEALQVEFLVEALAASGPREPR